MRDDPDVRFHTLRVSNADINTNLDGVMDGPEARLMTYAELQTTTNYGFLRGASHPASWC